MDEKENIIEVKEEDSVSGKESKHSKFVRLANKRTNKAIDMILLIGNLSNTDLYDYTPDEIEQIISTLRESVTYIEKRFADSKQPKMTFSLKTSESISEMPIEENESVSPTEDILDEV